MYQRRSCEASHYGNIGSLDNTFILGCGTNPKQVWCMIKSGVTDALTDLLRNCEIGTYCR